MSMHDPDVTWHALEATPRITPEQAHALREPFPPEQIGKLPKGGTELDFVGHAAVTDRLLQVDPEWAWEPLAYADDGGPLIRIGGKDAELWIKLTVCGVTRIGVGTAPAGAFELPKQLISDAIRNAAMRFGTALDLWSRQELHPEPEVVKIPPDRAEEIVAVLNAADAATRKAWTERFRVNPRELPLDLLPDANDWLSDLEAAG